MKHRVWILALFALLISCGGKSKVVKLPPAPLPEFSARIQPQRLWSVDLGSAIKGGDGQFAPVLAGETVYAAHPKGEVAAIEAVSGKRRWTASVKGAITAAPAVGEGLVLLGTEDGVVFALDQNDGKQRWEARLSSETLASGAVDAGMAIVRTLDGGVHGLDSADGKSRWSFKRESPALTLRGGAAPLATLGAVLVGSDNGKVLVADIKNGRVLWEMPVAQPHGRTEIERLVDINTTPLLKDGVLYVAVYQNKVVALEIKGRRILWSRDISSHRALAADQDAVYATDDKDNVLALNRQTGADLWKQEALVRRRLSAPVVADEYAVVVDFEGYAHWLDRKNGQIAGRTRLGSEAIGGITSAGGTVFAMTRDGAVEAMTAGATRK
jgi:outer membrane protein assembly factor BamB